MNPQSYTFTPIGIATTNFRKKYDAPRQPLTETQPINTLPQDGVITLFPHYNYEQALADLVGFKRIWVLYVFHENAHWKPKVLPPKGRVKRGVFATRAPYRPNPIGMSVLELKEIQGLRLWVGNCDLLDGTPVLDIKPYLAEYDSFPASKAGWWDAERVQEQRFTIDISPRAAEHIAFLAEHGVFVVENLRHILERDPFPHPYHRIKQLPQASNDEAFGGNDIFEIAYKEWRLRYAIHSNHVLIHEVRSGFAAEQISEDNSLHRTFQSFFE